MAVLREVLDRFRAAGPPGSAAPAAVPADRRSLLLDELAPVFAALAPAQHEAAGIVAEATAEAARIRADADRAAELIVRQAEDGRAAVRAAAFAATRAAAAQRAGTREAQTRHAAEQIRDRAAARRSVLVGQAVAHARRALGATDRMPVP